MPLLGILFLDDDVLALRASGVTDILLRVAIATWVRKPRRAILQLKVRSDRCVQSRRPGRTMGTALSVASSRLTHSSTD